jgi:hypothetical protein
LLAAVAESLGSGELAAGFVTLGVDFQSLGFGEIEDEQVENRESREGKEEDEFFFAVGHEEGKRGGKRGSAECLMPRSNDFVGEPENQG